MKRIPVQALILFLILLFLTPIAAANEIEATSTVVQAQMDRIDMSEVEGFWKDLVKDYKGYLPGSEHPGIVSILMEQGEDFSIKGFFLGFVKYFFHELLVNGKLLGTIIIITVFAMILETMQSAFEQNAVSKTAYAISYMVLIILAINSFRVAISYAQEAITDMVNFMLALIPLVLALLASSGNLTSVAMFHPLIIFMVNISGTVISQIIFLLLFMSSVLSIVSSFSDKYQVTQLANLIRNISLGLLGHFFNGIFGRYFCSRGYKCYC